MAWKSLEYWLSPLKVIGAAAVDILLYLSGA